MKIMKRLIQKLRKVLSIHIVGKRLEEDSGHWTDDWEKAEYKIRKLTNENGYVNYTPYRTLNGKTILATPSNPRGYKTKKEALKAIENSKAFYRENWNSRYTIKEEWIKV